MSDQQIRLVADHARAQGRADAMASIARFGCVALGSYEPSNGTVAVLLASTLNFDEGDIVVRERWLSHDPPKGDERVVILQTDHLNGALPISNTDALGREI